MAPSRSIPEPGNTPREEVGFPGIVMDEKGIPHAQPSSVQPAAAKTPPPITGVNVSTNAVATPDAPTPPSQPDSQGDDGSDRVAAIVLEQSPPWLISMVFHLVAVIVMGLIVYVNIPRKPIELKAESIYANEADPQLKFDSPAGMPDANSMEATIITPQNLPPVDDPFAAPGHLETRTDGTMVSSDIPSAQIGLALSGRQEGSRQNMLQRGGGSGNTEGAVLKGLEWLARNQQRDGSWSLAGPYSDGGPKFNDCEAAATAMALLAFQGAGNTHLEGKFKKNVANGWRWLLKQQDSSGCFFQSGGFNYRFYAHGQCAIAICELYAMTKDPKFKEPAQRAVNYCLQSQGTEGGWRYSPNADSDVSVTGWIVMALQSAKMAGLSVPDENLQNVAKFLDAVAQEGGARYPYQKGEEIRRSMTAEALLIRQYLGWKHNDPRLVAGVNWITSPENLVDFQNNRDVYYWYYATQVAHHMGGEPWKRWNDVMKRSLPEQQVPRGKESGSWDPSKPSEDQWGRYAGRLYVTCLSIYMLEVYYRHMPLYSSVYSETPAKAK